MANQTTAARRPTTGAETVAYAIGFLIGVTGLILGLALPSVPWLAFGGWVLVSMIVLLIARAPGQPGVTSQGTFGSIFQVESWALWTILGLGIVAALVIVFAR